MPRPSGYWTGCARGGRPGFFRLPPPALVLSSRFTINLYQSENSRMEKLLDEIDRHGKKQPKTDDWHSGTGLLPIVNCEMRLPVVKSLDT